MGCVYHVWLHRVAIGTDGDLGYADAFGVFQDYYSEHEPFKESGDIAVIGTCAMV